jgi:hypothetical protein
MLLGRKASKASDFCNLASLQVPQKTGYRMPGTGI